MKHHLHALNSGLGRLILNISIGTTRYRIAMSAVNALHFVHKAAQEHGMTPSLMALAEHAEHAVKQTYKGTRRSSRDSNDWGVIWRSETLMEEILTIRWSEESLEEAFISVDENLNALQELTKGKASRRSRAQAAITALESIQKAGYKLGIHIKRALSLYCEKHLTDALKGSNNDRELLETGQKLAYEVYYH